MIADTRTKRVNVLGVGVHPVTLRSTTNILERWIAERLPNYVCVTGVHGIMESVRDVGLKEIHNKAGLVTPDGMPLVWLARLQGFRDVTRVYGPDLMLAMTALSAERGYRNYYLGGGPGTAERLAEQLTRKHPGLQVVGTHTPPFRPMTAAEDAQLVYKINAAQPDIVWLGLSCPKQERWMAAHLGVLSVPVMLGVGAAFDFLSGEKPQAPRWMQRSGIEWLFRAIMEPRRLGIRYLRNNPAFVYLICRQLLTGREA